jgi:DNA-binding LytR/AlgR family response regulator
LLTIRIALCEDQSSSLDYIENLILEQFDCYDIEVRTSKYLNGTELLAAIRSGEKFELFLLDIDMPEINGIELGKRIRQFAPDSYIVFVSNKEEMVFQSFNVRPYRFIRKSRIRTEMPVFVRDLINEYEVEEEKVLMLQEDHSDTVYHVKMNQIVFIEVMGKYCTVHCSSGDIEIRHRMKDFELSLEKQGFIKCHRSFLVNYRYIFSIRRNMIILDDQRTVPISRSKNQIVRDRFFSLINGEEL